MAKKRHCSGCGAPGHNIQSCPYPGVNNPRDAKPGTKLYENLMNFGNENWRRQRNGGRKANRK